MAKYFGDIGKAVKGACPIHPVPARSSRPLIIRANNDENEPRIPSRDPPMRARPAHPPTRPFIPHSADVLTGGLSYDNKFNISSKATRQRTASNAAYAAVHAISCNTRHRH